MLLLALVPPILFCDPGCKEGAKKSLGAEDVFEADSVGVERHVAVVELSALLLTTLKCDAKSVRTEKNKIDQKKQTYLNHLLQSILVHH